MASKTTKPTFVPTCRHCGAKLVRFAAFICEACARKHWKIPRV